jgi:hypothetical protein
MMVSRRTFLLGASAAIAATSASVKVAGKLMRAPHVAHGFLDPRLKFRRIGEIAFSCMPTAEEIAAQGFKEEPLQFTFFRNDEALYHNMSNPRANWRWVVMPGQGIVAREGDLLRFEVEPAWTHCSFFMASDIEERPDYVYDAHGRLVPVRRRFFAESFQWKDGEVVLSSIAAMDLQDQHVLETTAA